MSSLYQRVQRTLAISREAKLSFPAVFMNISGRPTGDEEVMVAFKEDDTFRDGKGELDLCALAAIADAALGAPSDMKTGSRVRPATAHIELQLTGAPRRGDTAVETRFVGFTGRSRVKQSLVSANIKCGGTPVAYLSAACVLLDLPEDRARTPWPWLPEDFRLAPQQSIELDADELAALEACERAEAAATAEHRFIEHFWCGIPEASNGEAHLRVKVTPHLGNRMGHVQGGLLLGMAMKVANAATPRGMQLSNISAYFVSPGVGPVLDVHSTISHQGRRLATVCTQISGASGKLVLEAASQHVAS